LQFLPACADTGTVLHPPSRALEETRMRLTPSALSVCVLCIVASPRLLAAAPPETPPAIHHVALHDASGMLTIVGTGFHSDQIVAVDGQPVPQLAGSTDTVIRVPAPARVLTTPGVYRVTVADRVRQSRDPAFAAHGVVVPAPVAVATRLDDAPVTAPPSTASTSASPLVAIENAGPPFTTALGHEALLANTAMGFRNSALGYRSLRANTTATDNTGVGYQTLSANTGGGNNTAIGSFALEFNGVGNGNTAAGSAALRNNSSGSTNTATGAIALYNNTLGSANTATGQQALYFNTTGTANTVSGSFATWMNSTGFGNTAVGMASLFNNTTGSDNVAIGYNAGVEATTGSFNVFVGSEVRGAADDAHTIRIGLPYDPTAGQGQNRTFVAGVHGTALTGPAVPVFVDANGQLGTLTPAVVSGPVGQGVTPLHQQLEEQRAANAELRRRLAQVEAQLDALMRAAAGPAGSAVPAPPRR
jgi:hypothetical protein